MSDKMLKFVNTDKEMPEKRGAGDRVADFDEIYNEFDVASAETQASRCSQCGVPFCQINCPLHNNIPDWLMLTAEGRMEEAYKLSSQTNNIAYLQQAAQEAWNVEGIGDDPPRRKIERVGIIGAGPAGLAAADMLREKGYQVTVYDRYDRVGGLLIYGIPGFKLEKHVVQRRHKLLEDGGVTFRLNCDIGTDISFDEIREAHDAVLVATGVYKARDISAPGIGMGGIVPALDYLTASNRKSLGDEVADFDSGLLNAEGRNVVVIGGGDTAMDCVRTAIRQKANSVTCLYRRDRANMPGSQREVANAEEEGVDFRWLSAPQAFLGDNHVRAVQAQKIHLGQPDATGRQVPQIIEDSSHEIPADLVIKALGFDPEDIPTMFGAPELEVSKWGTIGVDWRTMMTNLPGVFAAGDIVRGASLVVWGVRDGRDAAESIHSYIMAQSEAPRVAAAGA